MGQGNLDSLAAFAVIAEERSFTRAAARLGQSQSSLSHAMKALEERLDQKLLSRTTRSVAPTQAGEDLLETLRPALEQITQSLDRLSAQRDVQAGTVRLTMTDDVAEHLIWPVLSDFLSHYPQITVEVDSNDAFTDIVKGRFDAGIRLGERIEKDMIAVQIGRDAKPVVVAGPSYICGAKPVTHPDDLQHHTCIQYRLPTSARLYDWQFEKDGRRLDVRVDGRIIFNDGRLIRLAALAGQGFAYLYRHMVADDLAAGRLCEVLTDWTPPAQDFYAYYPDRRKSPALMAFLSHLRAG